MNLRGILYIAAGYLSGSVLFAEVAGALFGKRQLLQLSEDKNPGTVNAFKYCGFRCGVLTLAGDLAKTILIFPLCGICRNPSDEQEKLTRFDETCRRRR